MPELKLLLKTEPENAIDGWTLADGHWVVDPEGVGVLLVVSPAMRAKLEAGVDARTLSEALKTAAHCADVVLERQGRAVLRKAMQT